MRGQRFQFGMIVLEYGDRVRANEDPFVEIYNTIELPHDAADR